MNAKPLSGRIISMPIICVAPAPFTNRTSASALPPTVWCPRRFQSSEPHGGPVSVSYTPSFLMDFRYSMHYEDTRPELLSNSIHRPIGDRLHPAKSIPPQTTYEFIHVDTRWLWQTRKKHRIHAISVPLITLHRPSIHLVDQNTSNDSVNPPRLRTNIQSFKHTVVQTYRKTYRYTYV